VNLHGLDFSGIQFLDRMSKSENIF
jgi:hypothetical protein